MQMFFKIGALRNFAIFTGKYLCWSLFLIKFQALRPAILFKRDFNIGVFMWISRHFYEQLFLLNTSGGCFCQFDKVTVQYCQSSLNQIHNVGCFLLKRFVDLVRVCYCTILVETIPTRFYWLTCRKQKLVQSKSLEQRLFVLILGFWQCRQVFVHYLMPILMICK